MNEDERILVSYRILLTIHTLTGWIVPLPEFMDILVKQFSLKLQENYANLNEQEVEYAFRNKSMEVKDWGKAMNLGLIDEIIIPYIENRMELSKIEEQEKNKQKRIEAPTETIDVVDMIEDWRNDPKLNMLLIPLFFYDFLIESEQIKITDSEKWEWFAKAKESIKSELLQVIADCQTTNALNDWKEYQRMEIEKQWAEPFLGRIRNRAKRLIVFDYLTKK